MKMLLNRTYQVTYGVTGIRAVSFQMRVTYIGDWHDMLERLAYKQRNWPERNYRLQIWDAERQVWLDHSQNTSKYALFSED
jgi:hypothetical protein